MQYFLSGLPKDAMHHSDMYNYILGTRVDPTSYDLAVVQILDWARASGSHSICVANVHVVMEGYDHSDFSSIVNRAELVVPDGMPLVWALRRKGFPHQQRVYGPELTIRLITAAAEKGIQVGFLGSSPETLELLKANVCQQVPGVKIAYAISPPFRQVSQEEDELIVKQINDSGTKILFVGLGCPKQEKWMAAHIGRVQAVMVGVGAAFDFIAGAKQQAPKWMQPIGLEWLFRLSQEPGRLWRRYLYHNPRFVFLVMLPLFFKRSHPTI
jgi:N-acetylglucosaminyldiphosphoundecaprenol N-acetyl-beta-D-mannosaminyltransferase